MWNRSRNSRNIEEGEAITLNERMARITITNGATFHSCSRNRIHKVKVILSVVEKVYHPFLVGGVRRLGENRYMHTDGGSGGGLLVCSSVVCLPIVFRVASSHSPYSLGNRDPSVSCSVSCPVDPSVSSSVSCPVITKRSSAVSHGTINGTEFVTEV
jgi:hypothetical protein